jgi:hypothetical protein
MQLTGGIKRKAKSATHAVQFIVLDINLAHPTAQRQKARRK